MEFESSVNEKTLAGYYKGTRLEMLNYIPSTANRILEVGCGEGGFIIQLKTEQRELWGVELNQEVAQKAALLLDHVLVGSFDDQLSNLPLDYFDCVIFNDVLEHLYEPWKTLRDVKKLLNKNGVLVSSIPNFRYISNLITEVLIKKDFEYKPEGGILDDTHIRFFTSKSIRRMFEKEGYEIVLHEGIRPCRSWKEKMLITFSGGFFNDCRYKQFATVAKPIHK